MKKSNITIALIDANNFFVSCERLFRPDLAHKPVVVLSSNDGCVISRSEEAKALGIPMGEPHFKLRSLIEAKGVAVFSSNFELYRDVSRRVVDTLTKWTNDIEVYSVDESFVKLNMPDGQLHDVAHALRAHIARTTGIPVSVGVAPTKTLAKVATHFAKPGRGGSGARVLTESSTITHTLSTFPIDEVWGIGRQLTRTLEAHGIHTAGALIASDEAWLRKHIHVTGLRTVYELRGISCFPLGEAPTVRKSLLDSESFSSPTDNINGICTAVARHARKAAEILRKEGAGARDIHVFLRTSGKRSTQHTVSKGMSFDFHTNDTIDFVQQATRLTRMIYTPKTLYKKAGVYVSSIAPVVGIPSATLFGASTAPRIALMKALDHIRGVYGDCIQTAMELGEEKTRARHTYRSPRYTTRWSEIPQVH